MIKCVVFDFGNVIAFFDHQRAIRRLLPHTNLPSPEAMLRFMYENDLEYRYECGELTTGDVYAAARDRAGLDCSQEEFVDAFSDIFWPNPPMADLIPRLKENGYRLVLASNTNAAHYERFRDQFRETLSHFDGVSVSHEAGARKPHERFFEHTHRMTACERSECVFVDDLAANVDGARAFGWHAVQYTKFDDLIPQLRTLGVEVSGSHGADGAA
jgi:putative hydrolase of the HAD superfamily